MEALRRVFGIYIYGSIHVAVSVLSLVLMTYHMFRVPIDWDVACFAFCGTLFSYNFMKYDGLFRVKRKASRRVKLIVGISTVALVVAAACFFRLGQVTQLSAIVLLALTALYTVPFFPNRQNLRNWSGIKIYLVAFCWAGVTTLLPLVDAGVDITTDVCLKFVQRFLLIIVLILIFEIIDLKEDDPHLKTIPQQIGVKNAKIMNLLLLIPFYTLELLKTVVDVNQLFVNVILVVVVALFTVFASPNRPKYYTLFWVEAIPIAWYMLVLAVSAM